jgi:hypothetical protein
LIEPAQLRGKRVLVGVTHVLSDGSVEQEQHAGVAEIEDRATFCLVKILCTDGRTRSYPFHADTLSVAGKGDYHLRSTGEIVRDPDFLMTWEVSKGSNDE